jgi:hypothetical protein
MEPRNHQILWLRTQYKESETSKEILDHFAARSKNSKYTKIQRLDAVLPGISRHEFETFFVELDAHGFGKLIIPRQGDQNSEVRFRWYYDLITVGRVAKEAHDVLVPRPDAMERDDDADEQCEEHVYNTSHGTVTLRVPNNLTKEDVATLLREMKGSLLTAA